MNQRQKTKRKFELPVWSYLPLAILAIAVGIYISLIIQGFIIG